jgi:hypothetical protein
MVSKIFSKPTSNEQFMFLIVIAVHVVMFRSYFVKWCTHMYWVWAMGGVNYGHETKLQVRLLLQINIPWYFDGNN